MLQGVSGIALGTYEAGWAFNLAYNANALTYVQYKLPAQSTAYTALALNFVVTDQQPPIAGLTLSSRAVFCQSDCVFAALQWSRSMAAS